MNPTGHADGSIGVHPVMIPTLHDIESEADVNRLVGQFYDRIQQDPDLGPIFNGVAQVDWAHHLPKIAGFWSTVLLGTGQYKDNPVTAHLALGQKTALHSAHFERWVGLFTQTVDELFRGERAELAKMRAQSIAVVLQTKLYGAGLLHHP